MFQIYTYEFINSNTGNVIESLTTRSVATDVINKIVKRLEIKHNIEIIVNKLELIK